MLSIDKIQSRSLTLQLEPTQTNDTRTSTFSFSSEYEAQRVWGKEILSHAPNAIDFSRSRNLNFLWNHNQDIVLGKVEKVWVDNRRGYCNVKWSNSQKAQEYKREVDDGILDNISFYYTIDDAKDVGEGKILVTRWTPLEISLVSVPVDPTVGIGRSLKAETMIGETIKIPIVMGEETATITPPDLEQLRSDAIATERERISGITALGRSHNFPDLATKLIEEGKTLEYARSAILDAIVNRPQQPVAANPVSPLGLTDKEQRSYSICRAINAHLAKDWSKAGFERECHLEIEKRSGVQAKGFFVPIRDLRATPVAAQRAPYAVGTNPTGGYTVATDLLAQDFIELLRNRMVVMQMGAMMLNDLQGNVAIPKQATSTTAYWVAENEDITESEATFGQISLTPKTIAARSQYSRLMLLQSSIDIENFIRMDLAKVLALGIDYAALNGSGTGGQPRGIRNTPGIASVSLGTNGDVPTWSAIVALETAIAASNAEASEMAYLTTPQVRGKLKTTIKATNAVGEFIWQDTDVMNGVGMLNGYRAYCTNQVPSNLTKGTGTNLSAIFFGAWSQLIIASWGSLDILPNAYGAGYNKGAIDIRAMKSLDINLRHSESFAFVGDVVTT